MTSKVKVLISFLILSFFTTNISAQDTQEEIPKEWIFKLVQFRDYLLRKDEDQLYALRDMLDKWEKLGITEEERSDIIIETVYGSALYEYSNRFVSKTMNKQMAKRGVNLSISEDEVELIKQNFELIELIGMGVLDQTYPFVLDKDLNILKEIKLYEFAEEESIAEIGAGTGMFALLLKLFYPDMTIYVNEKSFTKAEFLNIILEKNSEVINTQNYFAIKGQKKSTNLEEHSFKKIIVRKNYHHFSKEDEMLGSIKKSMTPESRLYILELYRTADNYKKYCKHILPREEIVSVVSKNGLELVKETQLTNGQSLLEYKLVE